MDASAFGGVGVSPARSARCPLPPAPTLMLPKSERVPAMSFKHLTSACLILLLSVLMTQCTSSKSNAKFQGQPAPQPHDAGKAAVATDDAFAAALERAERSAESDGFSRAFKVEAKISLAGGDVNALSQFRVNPDGSFSVVDYERRKAGTYDRTGAYVRPIGGSGNQPGSQVWPSDAVTAGEGTTAVADFQGHRVNVFSNDGKFRSSFIYTPQNFSAQRVLYDDTTRVFYLYGNRWQMGPNGQLDGASLLHKYSADGKFVASYLPFPEEAKALDLYSYNTAALDMDKGEIFVSLPFDYKVYRLAPDGELSTYLTGKDTAFKAPTEGLEAKKRSPEEGYRYVQNWRLKWTPITNLVVDKDKLLVQYQTFDPLRYTVDVWSRATKKKLATFATNHAILTRDHEGYIYFLENLEAKGQERYDIIRAKLKVS